MTLEAQILTARQWKDVSGFGRDYAEVGDNMASSCSMSATPFGNSPSASFTWPLAF
jgi:hypothetical protein